MLLLHFFKEFYCPHAFSGSFIVLGFYLKEWWWRDTRGLTLTLPLKNALHRWGIQTLQEGRIQRRGGGIIPLCTMILHMQMSVKSLQLNKFSTVFDMEVITFFHCSNSNPNKIFSASSLSSKKLFDMNH